MYKALVCCRAGMGSSMLLKIKADQVISENGYPIQTCLLYTSDAADEL